MEWWMVGVAVVAIGGIAMAHAQEYEIVLDPTPASVYPGDVVTFSGTLTLPGGIPEGAAVLIHPCGVPPLAAPVDESGRFAADQTVESDEWASEGGDWTYNIGCLFGVSYGDNYALSREMNIYANLLGPEYQITLDPTPASVYPGDTVTFSGTLTLPGGVTEGDFVFIDICGDWLSASVDGAGRFAMDWTVGPQYWTQTDGDGNGLDECGFWAFWDDWDADLYVGTNWTNITIRQHPSELEYELTLDPIPSTVFAGDVVTFSGTLALPGGVPEGAAVRIDCNGETLAVAPADGAGRYAADWTADLVSSSSVSLTNDDGQSTLCFIGARYDSDNPHINPFSGASGIMLVHRPPGWEPGSSAAHYNRYIEFRHPPTDFENAPVVMIAPSYDHYGEVRERIAPVMEGILQLSEMLGREYGGDDGRWDVSFGVAAREQLVREADIVIHIVTDKDDPSCGVDYSGTASGIGAEPAEIRVCSLERYSDEAVAATAAHEFMHAVGLGHAFNFSDDMMCGAEDGSPTCDPSTPKSLTPSDFDLAAIVAAYGTDGWRIPNSSGISFFSIFTFQDYLDTHASPGGAISDAGEPNVQADAGGLSVSVGETDGGVRTIVITGATGTSVAVVIIDGYNQVVGLQQPLVAGDGTAQIPWSAKTPGPYTIEAYAGESTARYDYYYDPQRTRVPALRHPQVGIGSNYSEILYVGDPGNPPAGDSDSVLASFCAAHGCDLLTADKKAYAPWPERGAKEVRVPLFDADGRLAYLVRAA